MGHAELRTDDAPALRIAPYEPTFRDQAISLITGIHQQELGGGVTLEEQYDLQDIPGTYRKGNGNFWVALSGGKVIGTIGLIDLGNAACSLKKMFVNAAHRGKEKAVAQTLLDQLMQWARKHGFKHMYLGTGPTLLAAHRFYERNGFRDVTAEGIPAAVLATFVKIDTRHYYKAVT